MELTNEEGNVAYTGLMGKAGFSDKVESMFERVVGSGSETLWRIQIRKFFQPRIRIQILSSVKKIMEVTVLCLK